MGPIWHDGNCASGADVFDPATGERIARVAASSTNEIASAVDAAHAGFLAWRKRPASERAMWLRRVAEAIEAEADTLATLEVRENGKPLPQARFNDIAACIGMFRYFAELIENLQPARRQLGPVESVEHLCPLGVVAGIIPFNWPPIHFGGKVAPALAVGNAVVLKPGEQAPLTVMRLVEIAAAVLPDPVLHCVLGDGMAGKALIEHPQIRKVSFTGAPSTGIHVLRSAATNLTSSLMELGGKNPFIICADADLDLACADALEGAFINKGEACTAASRILVHRSVYRQVEARLAAAVARIRMGSGLDPVTDVGPVVSRAQMERVADYIRIGVEEDGARIAARASLPADAALADGYFVPATLFADVTPGMRIAREEIFGPVTCLIPFDDEEEAIDIANAVDFGLVSALYTRSMERAERIAEGIEAGMVMVNNYSRNFMGSPFGGIKASGFGREHCVHTLYEFGYLKTIRTPLAQDEILRWPAARRLLQD